MATVYFTQELRGRDVSEAAQFGDIAIVIPHYKVKAKDPMQLYEEAHTVLKNFTEDDYLLLAGDPNIICICSAILAVSLGEFKTLKWDRLLKTYLKSNLYFYPEVLSDRRNI
jgi:hypothetical protein